MGTLVTLIAERPGMVIGHRGKTIKELTSIMETRFDFDNPQIEVEEVKNPNLNANIMAHKLGVALERGWHFRRAGHSTVRKIMGAGARGCQVILAGKLTGERHRTEKFKEGHIKYCGETALRTMDIGYAVGKKKLGVIGIKVMIMKPDAVLPDEITILTTEEAKGIVPEAEIEKLKIDTSLEADDVIDDTDEDVENLVEKLIEGAEAESKTVTEDSTETVTSTEPVVGSETLDDVIAPEEKDAPEIQTGEEIIEPEKIETTVEVTPVEEKAEDAASEEPVKEIPEPEKIEVLEKKSPAGVKEEDVAVEPVKEDVVAPVAETTEPTAAEGKTVDLPSEPAEVQPDPVEEPVKAISETEDTPVEAETVVEAHPEEKSPEVTEVQPPADKAEGSEKAAKEGTPEPVKVKKKSEKKPKTATKKPRAKKSRTKKSEESKDTGTTESQDVKTVKEPVDPASGEASGNEQPDSNAAAEDEKKHDL